MLIVGVSVLVGEDVGDFDFVGSTESDAVLDLRFVLEARRFREAVLDLVLTSDSEFVDDGENVSVGLALMLIVGVAVVVSDGVRECEDDAVCVGDVVPDAVNVWDTVAV